MYAEIRTTILQKYEQRGISIKPASVDKYILDVKKIQSLISSEGAVGDLSFLYDVDAVVSVVESMRGRKRDPETGEKVFLSNNTKRNYYQSIVSVLDGMNDYTSLASYQKLVNALNTSYKHDNKIAHDQLTKKNEEALISYDALKEVISKSDEEVRQIRERFGVTHNFKGEKSLFNVPTWIDDMNTLQTNLLLKLYFHFPARNEFATLKKIDGVKYENMDKETKEADENNYWVQKKAREGNSCLVINTYKTKGLYDTRILEINEDIQSVFNYYWTIVRRFNKIKNYIVKEDGSATGSDGTKSIFYARFYDKVFENGTIDRWSDSPMTNNKLSKYFARFFLKEVGKPLSTTAIAKIVNSHDNKEHADAISFNSLARGSGIGTLASVYMPMLPQ
mgnify:FL=1